MGKCPVLLLSLLLHAPAIAQTIAIGNVHLVPLDRDIVLRDHAVIIEQGRIAALVPMGEYYPPPGAQRIDGGFFALGHSLVFVDDTFALKGGTAINLFVRDMPRL